jgi:hypothetical protein
MRRFIVVGIVIVGLGAFVLLRGASFTSRRDVLKVGDVKITADEQQSIPAWVGAVAVVVGLAIVAGSSLKRTS